MKQQKKKLYKLLAQFAERCRPKILSPNENSINIIKSPDRQIKFKFWFIQGDM